jgi:antibiotic biosynthesis monooxygenase (ABM) superfamily enzyme
LRTIDHSFGNWFTFDEDGGQARAPSNLKTVIAVWVGLYPTVMLLAIATAPAKLPVWEDRIISNLLGSFAMTFVTMPFYVNPLLKRWLYLAPDAPKTATNIRAALLIVVPTALWAVLFWLVTTVFWKPF